MTADNAWYAWFNGDIVPESEVRVPFRDRGFKFGDAVFDTTRTFGHRIFKLDEHLDRLRGSALALAFREIPTRERLIEEIRRTLRANDMFDGVHVRLTLTRGVKITSGMDPRLNQAGSTLIVLAEHKAPVYGNEGLTLVTSSLRRFSPDTMDPKIHHCNLIQSILAKIEANTAGADDALMLDQNGFIAETNATHFFIVERGVVLTSRLVACPEGITRATVLELCGELGTPFEVRDLSLAEAYRCDEAFCTGTMGELVPVVRLDDRPLGSQSMGPVTDRLCQAFRRLTATGGTLVCDWDD